MRKSNVTRMDQARHTRTAGVCATSGSALVTQVLRSFQYAMPGVEDTEAMHDDLALIATEAAHFTESWKTLKRLLLQFHTHHGSDKSHIDFLLRLMSEADLLLKEIDPDFCAYAEAEDELEQQLQAHDADVWAMRQYAADSIALGHKD